jgi:DNA polymerase
VSSSQPIPLSADAAALAWLVGAGIDVLVADTPRNWLTPPPAPPAAVPRTAAPVAPVARATPASVAAPAATAAAAAANAATDLAGLDAAVRAFAHPLRRAEATPRLMTGATASGLVMIGDFPELPDSPVARLQTRMLAAIGLDAASVAEAHLLPWPTPGGRPPRDDEIAAFAPFVLRALALATPKLLLAFGDRAAALSGEARGVASLRGRWLAASGVPMLATFHPRRLLTQPELKRLAWADLQAFAARRETLS